MSEVSQQWRHLQGRPPGASCSCTSCCPTGCQLHGAAVGREVAEKIYERHCFFTEQLIAAGVDPETAEVDACRIEHVISNESFERLKEAAFRNQENEISALSKAIKDKPTE